MTEYVIPVKTVSELNQRGNWRAHHKRHQRQRRAAGLLTLNQRVEWFPLMTVTLTRVSPRLQDAHDNLPSALKHSADGICDALGIDDRNPQIEWRYDQLRQSKTHEVRVRIEERAT